MAKFNLFANLTSLNCHFRQNTRGYTLIELSIVLVIIAMIVSAISAGISLTKQSTIRAVINEIQTFQTALNNFKQQYGYWPGDFPKATTLWPGTYYSNTTYNGNGNGIIDFDTSMSTQNSEILRLWQHLSLAGLLVGNYNATLDPDGFAIIGTSIPGTAYSSLDRYTSACWTAGWDNTNRLFLGGFNRSNCWECKLVAHTNAVSPVDNYQIDVKIDDGIRDTGNVIGMNGKRDMFDWDPNCYDTSNPTGYMLTNTDRGCFLQYKFD
jgi:prepilin-type N-terminal cleavage/methylation domain-containing protein